MGLLSNLFSGMRTRFVGYFGRGACSTPFSKEVYEQETVRAVVDCIAAHTAKAEAMHVILDKNGRVEKIQRSSPYVKLLNQQPNPLMTGFDLKYKLVTQLETATTAMCYVRWNGVQPEAIIPIAYHRFEFARIEGGGYAVRFTDPDGDEFIMNVEDVVILRKFFNNHEVGGDGNSPIYNTLDMVKASDDGLMEALSVSNKVRGLLRQKKAMLAREDVEESTKEFTRRFEEAAKKGGIVGVDSTEEYTPLNVTAWSANAAQMREIRENILRYWRVSNAILTSDYNESQWQAFFESVIEPRLIQMGQAFTNVCFTPRERDIGNRIIFNASVLMNTSVQTKTNILTVSREIGLFSKNEQREMFGYPPVEGGDEYFVSLNYVKGSDQSKYQTGQEPEEEQSGQNETD